uniref:Uncharacterized protein n=1 Tax=Triticum urartu TaxID=4572 RepID=A0A8R7QKT6_TRIUA
MGHPKTEKTRCSQQTKNYLMPCYLLKKLLLSWLPFARSIDQAMPVAIQNMIPFWFLILSVVYFVISVLPIHVFLLVCWPGLFFAQYMLELVGVPCRVRSVPGLL